METLTKVQTTAQKMAELKTKMLNIESILTAMRQRVNNDLERFTTNEQAYYDELCELWDNAKAYRNILKGEEAVNEN